MHTGKPFKNIEGLLIYPPNQLMDVETPRPDGSLGPLYLAASLEKYDIRVDILDASVGSYDHDLKNTFYRSVRQDNGLIRIGMNFDEIADHVCERNYDFVGISSNFTPQTRMAIDTAVAIKETNPEIKIYAGGVNARALKNRFLETGYFDGLCLSEGELIFPMMVHNHFSGSTLHDVAGCAFNDNGTVVTNPVDDTCFPDSLDELPMPAWDKLPLEKYSDISSPHGVGVDVSKGSKYAPIMTSRGCTYKCLYCHISTEKRLTSLTGAIGKLRCHSIGRVVDEIDYLRSLGVTKLFFEDDSLFAKKDRAKEIFRRVRNKDLSVSNVNGVNLVHFFMNNNEKVMLNKRMDIDYNLIEVLKDSGFDQIVIPVESASQRILKKYATNKLDLDKMDIPLLINKMTDVGIRVPINLMIGFPDETEEEIKVTVDFAKKLMDAGSTYATFFVPIPFPGSCLYEIAIKEGYLKEDFNTDIMNWKKPIMRNTIVSAEKLEEIRDNANESVNTKEHLRIRLKQSAGHRISLV